MLKEVLNHLLRMPNQRSADKIYVGFWASRDTKRRLVDKAASLGMTITDLIQTSVLDYDPKEVEKRYTKTSIKTKSKS